MPDVLRPVLRPVLRDVLGRPLTPIKGVGVRIVHNLILNAKNLTLNGKNLTLRA